MCSWPSTIWVPGVCQYAHKLAILADQSLHTQLHESLADKLFYLLRKDIVCLFDSFWKDWFCLFFYIVWLIFFLKTEYLY